MLSALHRRVHCAHTLAATSDAGAFVDPTLHFYALHARQWLLIALARAAQDHADVLVPHADWLKRIALDEEPHVLMRMFASRALMSMMSAGAIDADSDLRGRLESVNISPFQPVKTPRYQRGNHGDENATLADGDRFFFGIDIGPYYRLLRLPAFSEHQRP